ncbi:unnamed protein product [Arctogadus glacialis]
MDREVAHYGPGRWPTMDREVAHYGPGGGPLWTREVAHYGPGSIPDHAHTCVLLVGHTLFCIPDHTHTCLFAPLLKTHLKYLEGTS